MSTTATVTGGLLVKTITNADDLTAGMFWHLDRSSWPHRIDHVNITKANVRITDQYGTQKTFKRSQKVPTAIVIGDLPA